MRFLSALFFSTVLFLLTACNSTEQQNKYPLNLRLAVGDTFTILTVNEMNSSFDILGKKQETKSVSESLSRFEVQDSTAEGKSIQLTVTILKNEISFGDEEKNKIADSVVEKSGKIGKEEKLTILVKDNKVVNVKGVENLIASGNQISDSVSAKIFDEDMMRETMGFLFDPYPEQPVAVGETWSKKTTMNIGGMMMNMNSNYKLKEVKDGKAFINVSTVVDSEEAQNPLFPGLKTLMSGKQEGEIIISLADGYLVESKNVSNMKADMEMAGTKMPMIFDSKFTATRQ